MRVRVLVASDITYIISYPYVHRLHDYFYSQHFKTLQNAESEEVAVGEFSEPI